MWEYHSNMLFTHREQKTQSFYLNTSMELNHPCGVLTDALLFQNRCVFQEVLLDYLNCHNCVPTFISLCESLNNKSIRNKYTRNHEILYRAKFRGSKFSRIAISEEFVEIINNFMNLCMHTPHA